MYYSETQLDSRRTVEEEKEAIGNVSPSERVARVA